MLAGLNFPLRAKLGQPLLLLPRDWTQAVLDLLGGHGCWPEMEEQSAPKESEQGSFIFRRSYDSDSPPLQLDLV